MKYFYEKPMVNIYEFKTVDVVTTSGMDNDVRDDDNNVEWGS